MSNQDQTQDTKKFCSDISLQAGEPLFGTATQTNVFLLLEHNHVFGAKAIEASSLSQEVKDRLNSFSAGDKTTKAMLIRRWSAIPEQGIRFFIALVRERDPLLYEFILKDYEEFLSLDITSILESDPQYIRSRRTQPLILVCTNGRRDACCARKGLPVLDALHNATHDDDQSRVWQSSHMGGHRYAANVIFLPNGLLYGRVEPDSVPTILHAYQHNQVFLDNLRGRSCYDETVQVADYFLRQETQILGLDDFHLLDQRQIAPNQWEARFSHLKTGQVHQMHIASEKSEVEVFSGCALDKSAPFTKYQLLSHQIFDPES
jgi:hypothetical protein